MGLPLSLSEIQPGWQVKRLKKGDITGGNADIAVASKAIKADIAEDFVRYGVRSESSLTWSGYVCS